MTNRSNSHKEANNRDSSDEDSDEEDSEDDEGDDGGECRAPALARASQWQYTDP